MLLMLLLLLLDADANAGERTPAVGNPVAKHSSKRKSRKWMHGVGRWRREQVRMRMRMWIRVLGASFVMSSGELTSNRGNRLRMTLRIMPRKKLSRKRIRMMATTTSTSTSTGTS
mmetsp:Transcript_22517/g.48948  ORF Transcript_22517/g.48948 Transcript_22517/m.48948 type:complete len:115 (+) Transcript_22517:1220-1564(+)